MNGVIITILIFCLYNVVMEVLFWYYTSVLAVGILQQHFQKYLWQNAKKIKHEAYRLSFRHPLAIFSTSLCAAFIRLCFVPYIPSSLYLSQRGKKSRYK